ncbi:MAG: GNAT family N-acetyltransferase [Hyphomicrobiales bacterium]
MIENFEIRPATLEDMRLFTDLVTQTGRNPGVNDHETYYKIDPNGFWVGCLGDKPIAFISAISHKTGFGFIGHFFVEPDYRSMGFGRKMFEHAFSSLQGYNICVDAPVEFVNTLQSMGFIVAYSNHRYHGIVKNNSILHDGVLPLSEIDFSLLYEYDSHCFPVTRIKYLHYWLTQKGAKCLVKSINSEIMGFGLIRPCVEGYRIGPLFADTEEVALELYESLTEGLQGNSIYIDVPETNPMAVDFVSRLDMREVLETVRMYNRFDYSIDEEKIYGLTSNELG